MAVATPHTQRDPADDLPPPLRAQRADDGGVYTRRPEHIEAIQEVLLLPRATLLARAQIKRRDAPGYIPSEVLIHLLRRSTQESSEQLFEQLYSIILKRVENLCRSARTRVSGGATGESVIGERLRQLVVDGFVALVAKDRQGYELKLDYLEISFDQYIARRRMTARRSIRRRESRTDQIEPPAVDGYVDPAIERALAEVQGHHVTEEDSLISRIDLVEAIAQLPEKERTVTILYLQDIPIGTNKLGVESISSILNCDPKTVRKYKTSAQLRLKHVLNAGKQS